MTAEKTYLPAPSALIEIDMESLYAEASPEVTEDNDPFMFQYGGLDEFQMRAEMRATKDRNIARNRHKAHTINKYGL